MLTIVIQATSSAADSAATNVHPMINARPSTTRYPYTTNAR